MPQVLRVEIMHLEARVVHMRLRTAGEEDSVVVRRLGATVDVHEDRYVFCDPSSIGAKRKSVGTKLKLCV